MRRGVVRTLAAAALTATLLAGALPAAGAIDQVHGGLARPQAAGEREEGPQIDPVGNRATGDHGIMIDPDGNRTAGDHGIMIDPNG